MNQLINKPSQGSKNILSIIAVIIITALVVGGGVYLQQKSAVENERNEIAETVRGEFQQEIADLKNQLSQLKETRNNEEVKPPELQEPVVKPPVNPTADWKTYTNETFGYSIKYPSNWEMKRGYKIFDVSSESKLDMSVGINDESGNNKVKIVIDYKEKSEYTLSQYASQITPLDKVTITDKESYKIGNEDGYKELVTISEPFSEGLCYFTQGEKYFYGFFTSEKSQSSEIAKILKSFRAR